MQRYGRKEKSTETYVFIFFSKILFNGIKLNTLQKLYILFCAPKDLPVPCHPAKNNKRKVQMCIHHYCRSCGEHAPLGRRMYPGGCRVSLGAAVHTSDWLMVLLAGPGPGWLNQAGKGGPRLGYFGAVVPWAACRVSCSDGGCWRGQNWLTCGHLGL